MMIETLGLVLAGGLARRMGGGDKALIRIGGETILQRVLARLTPQCSGIMLNANGDPARFADTGLPVVADSVPDFAGPLAGILAGLDWAAANRPDIADDRERAGRLPVPAARSGRAAACARAEPPGASRSPARIPATGAIRWSGLWPVALRDDLRHAVTGRGACTRSRSGPRATASRIADWPTTPVDPFFNVNTPEDAAEAERIAAQQDGARAPPEAVPGSRG